MVANPSIRTEQAQARRFIERLGVALHRAGAPSHLIESSTSRVADSLAVVDGGVLATPTALYLSTAAGGTKVVAVRPQDAHLERLVDFNHVARAVALGWQSVDEGLAELAELEKAPERYGPGVTIAAHGGTSAAATVLLGGGLQDLVVGAVLGVAVGATVLGLPPRAASLLPLSSGFIAAGLATVAAGLMPLSVGLVALSALIVLVPGLSLTVAMAEAASGLWASGVHRLTGAAVSVLQLAVGAALGKELVRFWVPLGGQVSPLPDWTWWAALLVLPATFAVLFRARPHDLGVLALASWAGFAVSDLAGPMVGPAAASTLGAFTVGVMAHLQARVRTVPAAVAKFPGILLLVPGSVSFRGLAALLEHQVVEGVETAFSALLLAACLVTGLTLAEVVVSPPRRHDWVG